MWNGLGKTLRYIKEKQRKKNNTYKIDLQRLFAGTHLNCKCLSLEVSLLLNEPIIYIRKAQM